MKTKCSVLVGVAAFLSMASPIHAQTFMGRPQLTASPMSFEASVYPITNCPATIKLSFNNRSSGGVHVIIRDEKGRKVYDEFETIAIYRRRLDLSLMPAGTYTVEVGKRDDLFIQAFTIEPPTMGRIALAGQPVPKNPDVPVDKKLIVSY